MNSTPESLTWRVAGGDPSRRGLFPRPVKIKTQPARRIHARGAVQASVVFDGEGRGFIADMAGVVQAFSVDGRPLWETKLMGGVSSTPAVHNAKPKVFVGTHLGWVYALETSNGSVLWKRQIPTSNDPRILSDLLYLPATDAVILSSWGGRFVALDAGSGDARFSWDAGLSPSSSASAGRNGLVYCLRAVANQGVELVAVSDGGGVAILHRTPEDRRGSRRALVNTAAVLDDQRGVIYHIANVSPGCCLHATSLQTGAQLWSCALPHTVQAPPTLRTDGVLLVADLAGDIHAIGSDGTVVFRCVSGCEYLLAGGASEAGGTFFLGDPAGVLHRIDRPGRSQAVFEANRSIQSRPTFDPRGNLFVPSTDHFVYRFSAEPTSASDTSQSSAPHGRDQIGLRSRPDTIRGFKI